jgi:hypothetical protein
MEERTYIHVTGEIWNRESLFEDSNDLKSQVYN